MPSSASIYFVEHLYAQIPLPKYPISGETPKQTQRNEQIRKRHADGESISELALAFNLSNARIHQLIHHRRN
jgi:Mor family transcriptional regulator